MRVEYPTEWDVDEAKEEEYDWHNDDDEQRLSLFPIPRVIRRHSYTRTDVTRRPFRLPKGITLSENRADPICAISAFNYKVNAKVGASRSAMSYLLSVLDTGAGPSLIRENYCPAEALKKLRIDREVINLTSATNHRMDFLGIVTLWVTIGTYTAKTPFVVVRNMRADVLLGCTYQDVRLEAIRPRRRVCELANGDVVLILRRQAARPRVTKLDEPITVGSRTMANFNGLRVVRRTVIPPRSEMLVDVITHHKGMRLIEGRQEIWEKKGGHVRRWCRACWRQ